MFVSLITPFLKFLFLVGRELLYNMVLVSAIPQHESAIDIHSTKLPETDF